MDLLADLLEITEDDDAPTIDELSPRLNLVDNYYKRLINIIQNPKYKFVSQIKQKWVIVYGELGEGVQGTVGLFDTREDAEDYADGHNLGHYEKVVRELENKEGP